MIFNKNNILIKKKRLISVKTFAVFLLIILYSGINAQTDSLKIDNNTDKVISVSDTLTDVEIVNDTIPDQNILSDSVKSNGISPDAVDQVIDYTSKDSILFSLTEEKMYLYGTGDITAKEMNLKSAYVEISTDESYLYSESVLDSTGTNYQKPILKQDDETFTVNSIKYNFKTKKAIVKDVKTQQEQGYLHSDIAKMQTNKEFHIKSGKFTTCDLDHPHFYIKLTKAKKIPDKHTISGPMYFVIADIPLYFIGLPFGMLPNQKKNTSGLIIPEYGEEVNRGFFLRNGGYFLAINDHINASLLGDIYSKGTWGLTLKSNFKKKYKYSGNLELKYNKNKTVEKILPNSTEQTNFWVKGSYMQDAKANPNSTFSTSLNFGTSDFSSYNATNINEYTDNQKSSSISYRWSKPGSIFNFSANIRGSQNTKQKMINLDLPTVSFNMQRQFPFKNIGTGSSKWYKKIGVTLNVNAKNSINTGDSILFTRQTLYNMKNGLKYSVPVSTSFNLLNYITASPSINFTGRLYSSKIVQHNILLPDGDGVVNEIGYDTVPQLALPFDFNISIPFSTKIFGILKINKGNVQAIRHVLSPSLSFNYRPDFSVEPWDYYGTRIDPADTLETVITYSYYTGYLYGAPPSGRSGSIGFSIGNNLEMKLKNKNDTVQESRKVKLIDNFSVSTSYNLAVDSFNLSKINISGNTKLFKNFGLRIGASFDPYSIDTVTGVRINKFAISEENENKKLARFENARISLSGSLKPNKDKESSFLNPQDAFYYYLLPEIPYADFDLPWNFSVNYSLNIYNKFDKESLTNILDITQTLSLNGNISLTKNWKMSANTTYDFSARKFSYAQFSVNRDLHCWEMSFNVIPFGTMKSYSFRINIKSSIFKGVEYNKKKAWQDNLY